MPSKPTKSRPLANRRILVGRAHHQSRGLAEQLRQLGAEVLEIPFIEIREPKSYKPLDHALRNLVVYDWLILTSVNGVDALAQRIKKLRLTKKNLRHLQIAAIGPATKKAIEKLGLRVAVVPEQYVAESVVDRLRKKVKGKRVLLARAKVARDVIPRELRKLGAKVDVVEAYETVIPKSSSASLQAAFKDPNRRPHIVTFTSSSTAKNFAALLGLVWRGRPRPRKMQMLDGIKLASIGPVTSATLRELGLPVHIEAQQYTIPGLMKAIITTVAPASRRLSGGRPARPR